MKVIKTYWFSPMNNLIGIVIGEDEVTGERKAYIGTGDGFNQESDTLHIREMGAKLSPEIMLDIAKSLQITEMFTVVEE